MKEQKHLPERDYEEICGDSTYQVDELIQKLRDLQKKHGKKTKIRWNGGYYNVSVMIQPTKEEKE